MSFNQTYLLGAFEDSDKDEIEGAIANIEKVKQRIEAKKKEERPTGKEEKALGEATKELLKLALDLARRPHPHAPRDFGKPILGKASRKAMRRLFIYIDDNLKSLDDVNTTKFKQLVKTFLEALRIDAIDYDTIKVEETPKLAFEHEGVDTGQDPPPDESGLLDLGETMDWGSPDLSEARGSRAESETDEADRVSELDWEHKLVRSTPMEGLTTSNNENAVGRDMMGEDEEEDEAFMKDDYAPTAGKESSEEERAKLRK